LIPVLVLTTLTEGSVNQYEEKGQNGLTNSVQFRVMTRNRLKITFSVDVNPPDAPLLLLFTLVRHHGGALELGKSHEGLKKTRSPPWNSPLQYWQVTVEDPSHNSMLVSYWVLVIQKGRHLYIEDSILLVPLGESHTKKSL
jgi:hypothetical protein